MQFRYIIQQQQQPQLQMPIEINWESIGLTISIMGGAIGIIATVLKFWSGLTNLYQHLERQDVLFKKQFEVNDNKISRIDKDLAEFMQEYRSDRALLHDEITEVRRLIWNGNGIDKLVKQGLITQEQADKIKQHKF